MWLKLRLVTSLLRMVTLVMAVMDGKGWVNVDFSKYRCPRPFNDCSDRQPPTYYVKAPQTSGMSGSLVVSTVGPVGISFATSHIHGLPKSVDVRSFMVHVASLTALRQFLRDNRAVFTQFMCPRTQVVNFPSAPGNILNICAVVLSCV